MRRRSADVMEEFSVFQFNNVEEVTVTQLRREIVRRRFGMMNESRLSMVVSLDGWVRIVMIES
jgi:hypothetical protein